MRLAAICAPFVRRETDLTFSLCNVHCRQSHLASAVRKHEVNTAFAHHEESEKRRRRNLASKSRSHLVVRYLLEVGRQF